jgi:hypothetical protein
MTLTEYLNQYDPKRMPKVVLQKKEYWMGPFQGVPGYRVAPLTINVLPGSYVVKEGSTTIYTADKNGEPKSRSCFHLPNL